MGTYKQLQHSFYQHLMLQMIEIEDCLDSLLSEMPCKDKDGPSEEGQRSWKTQIHIPPPTQGPVVLCVFLSGVYLAAVGNGWPDLLIILFL